MCRIRQPCLNNHLVLASLWYAYRKFGAAMSPNNFRGCLFHSQIPRLAIVTLIALAFSTPAFCCEIHDAIRTGDLVKVKALPNNDPGLISSKDSREEKATASSLPTSSLPISTERSLPQGLSKDEQVQILLLRRMIDQYQYAAIAKVNPQTIYVAVDADLNRIGADPQRPSDAVMAGLSPAPCPLMRFTDYLATIGGFERWGGLIDVLWVGRLKWIDDNTVEVAVGRSEGPHSGSGEQLRLRLQGGKWQIESLGAWES
jgi:hypothetical protein